MSGLRLLRPGSAYELITGAVLRSMRSKDACGITFVDGAAGTSYVLRESVSCGRPVTALVQRIPGEDDWVYVPTDFTLEDLREVAS